MERDAAEIALDYINIISTHTLTWSVTVANIKSGYLIYISTHTLTWSVTILAKRHINHANISTHTLTWSVTVDEHCQKSNISNFNSHAHVERDSKSFKNLHW